MKPATYEHWDMLHDCGAAVPLHGKVLNLDGVLVAGLGGNFLGRVWYPPSPALHRNRESAMGGQPYRWRDGQRPHPAFQAAIYPDDFDRLTELRADILITHEAPSCHPFGFAAMDELARSLGVARSFHGHQHDDLSHEYALVRAELGFDARAVGYCSIKNGLGEHVVQGDPGW